MTKPTARGVRRALVAVLLGALALIGVTASPAAAIDPPLIDEVSISPNTVGGNGGNTVTIRARITSEADLSGASVTIDPGFSGTSNSAEMQRESLFSEYWTTTVQVPRNNSGNPLTYDVWIFAQGLDGQVTNQVVGSFEQAVPDDAPQVTLVTVTPATRGYDGGPVTIRAEVGDDFGVAEVRADITSVGSGGGAPATVALAPLDGDPFVWVGTYQVPANPGLTVRKLNVTVTATDGSGQTGTRAPKRITVASRAVTSSLTTLDFGHVVLGQSRSLTAKLTNNTAAAASVTLAIPAGQPFVFRQGGGTSLTVSINAGAVRNVPVLFTPTARTTRISQLTLTPAIEGQVALKLPLLGTGVNPF